MKNDVYWLINPAWVPAIKEPGWIVLKTVDGRELASIHIRNFRGGKGNHGSILIHYPDLYGLAKGIVKPTDRKLASAKEYCRQCLKALGYRFLTRKQANLL